jgi:hypothetical protein
MSSPTPHRFKNPVWDIGDVLGWLIDRDSAQFGRIMTESDLRSALRRTFYTSRPRPERDPSAPTTLLHALQRGDLVASHPDKRGDDKSLGRDYWQAKDERDVRAAIARRLKFWREEVLALWPAELTDPTAPMLRSQVENRRKPRRGPEPGTVDRFRDSDRALFPELEVLMANGRSLSAAAGQLADQDKIAGIGGPASRAKRLAARYRRERGSGA